MLFAMFFFSFVSLSRWTYPLKSDRFEPFCVEQVSVLFASSLSLPSGVQCWLTNVFLTSTAAANAHQVTSVAKEGRSDRTACFFFFSRATLHQQVSPQTGRKMSKQRKHPAGKRKKKKKKKKQLFSGWTSKLICNQTASPLPVCWDASSNIHWFWLPRSLTQQQKLHWPSWRHVCSAFSCTLTTLQFSNLEKEISKRCQWHLWCLEECVLVSFTLCNSTWRFYYVWNQYNLLSQLGSFI